MLWVIKVTCEVFQNTFPKTLVANNKCKAILTVLFTWHGVGLCLMGVVMFLMVAAAAVALLVVMVVLM